MNWVIWIEPPVELSYVKRIVIIDIKVVYYLVLTQLFSLTQLLIVTKNQIRSVLR